MATTTQATALHSAFPWNLLPLSAAQRTGVQAALKMHQLELPSASGEGYNLKEVEKLQDDDGEVELFSFFLVGGPYILYYT